MSVKIWQEKVVIPTYKIGEPEKYPVFLEKRVYQGSSGVVYPHPVIEKIYDEKEDVAWNAIYLENDYIKIMILPELGGRVQMAYDKMKERHFVYYNNVIKPALVGLTGPWISGGIEFNWPQHHRPSTYDPVDSTIEENADGSKTIWVSEVEKMFRTKGMAGFTLHPDKAYLQIKVKLYNRTPQPQTFLWWANPAVKVNDDYQSVFPPDVRAVFDHGKRDVSKFPIATGTYYKMDYSAGIDISKYKNIPVPTSYMAQNSKYNFVGGYENDSKGGLLHVANHHVSPGKKQWTWGHGDFGRAWDRNLTDEDGPYIELMCGVYTDNQPDFTWLQPYEEKSFDQYFMPYQELGVVKNASKDFMMNVELEASKLELKVYATCIQEKVKICLSKGSEVLFEKVEDFTPGKVFFEVLDNFESLDGLKLSLYSDKGRELLTWEDEVEEVQETPDPAVAAKDPEDIASIELLYLNGLHLEQYRHATYKATDYYLEALKREPGDSRNNNAMGLWLMRRAKFKDAEEYFRKAIKTLTMRNPNPYDGEALFNLGMCLRYQGRFDEAYDAYHKSVWNAAWQDAGYFNVALIDCRRDDYELALENIDRSLVKNWNNHLARHMKVAILREMGRKEEALALAEDSMKLDRFNYGVLYEQYKLSGEQYYLDLLKKMMRDSANNFIEYASDYAWGGFYEEALELLALLEGGAEKYPMIKYLRAWIEKMNGNEPGAMEVLKTVSADPKEICFPNKLEEVLALELALELMPKDYMAKQYLGNFYYAFQQSDDALTLWEDSLKLDAENPIVLRNLALAYFNKLDKKEEALAMLEKAFRNDSKDARLLMELDSLCKRMNISYEKRLELLEAHPELVDYRDDLSLERISLLNLLGEHQKALDLILKRQFHPWEGGEGKVPEQYIFSLVSLAKEHIVKGEYDEALNLLESARAYPLNLGEGKLSGAQENDIYYWIGCCYDGMSEVEKAKEAWAKAAEGPVELSAAMYYNDQQPDKIFYQALAKLSLGKVDEARSRFNKLIDYGEKHLFDEPRIDYFAVSLPDLLIWEKDLKKQNVLHCKYLISLGNIGMGSKETAQYELDEILKDDRYHVGAWVHRNLVKNAIRKVVFK